MEPAAEETTLRLTVLGPQERREAISISALAPLSDLIQNLDALHPDIRGKSLRLVYAGRVLSEESLTLREHRVMDEAVLHVFVSDAPRRGTRAASRSAAVAAAGEAAATSTEGDPATLPAAARAGFDRLTSVGLDTTQISVLRGQFLPDVQREVTDVPLDPGETEAQHLLRMEDAWIRRQGPFSDFAMNVRPLLLNQSNPHVALIMQSLARRQQQGGGGGDEGFAGSNDWRDDDGGGGGSDATQPAAGVAGPGSLSSLLCGIALGSTMGFLMLLWVGQASLSRRFRLGVVVGVLLNFWMGWTAQRASKQQSSADKAAEQVATQANGAADEAGAAGLPIDLPAGFIPVLR